MKRLALCVLVLMVASFASEAQACGLFRGRLLARSWRVATAPARITVQVRQNSVERRVERRTVRRPCVSGTCEVK